MTHWTPAQRADAIGRALAVGADKASEQTGIPRRTISSWLSRERPAPELDAMIVDSRDQVAAKLWEAVTIGTEQVLAGLRDPKARLGDKANALRIVSEQYALLTGGFTERTENLNQNADWEPPELRNASPEVRAASDRLLHDVMEEVHAGALALGLAGVPGIPFEVDGLNVRAKLGPEDAGKVRYLLGHLSAAIKSGVPAAEIIDELTRKRIGPGDVG